MLVAPPSLQPDDLPIAAVAAVVTATFAAVSATIAAIVAATTIATTGRVRPKLTTCHLPRPWQLRTSWG